jgi:histidinol-phosphate aminotransferase
MSLSRRAFVRSLGVGGGGAISTAWVFGRSREALAWGLDPLETALQAAPQQDVIRISGNENARGPGDAALQAMRDVISGKVGRYSGNIAGVELPAAIARRVGHGLAGENILTSTGSRYILEAAVHAYVSPSKPLVNGSPSYSSPNRTAQQLGADVRLVPLQSDLRLDLDGMARAASGAGLVFLCNPNNPTAMAHSLADVSAFISRVKSSSPDTAILVDEAYLDYAEDEFETAAGQTLQYDDVFIARTFSKGYGMAGLRIGYAAGRPATLVKLDAAWGLGDVNMLTATGAIASLNDPAHMVAEREENRRVREFTINAFKEMGYEASDSQTNFIFVNIRRPAGEFRDATREQGVIVGRDFPPMEQTHARISLGTMEEMQQAVEVFKRILET